MTRLMKPQPGERCNDPACGTFGFMIAAHRYVKEHTDDFYDLDADQAKFEREEAFTGCELVHDTHRLALMNAMLHDINGQILLADTLSNQGKALHDFDLVLTNPPFGTKKGGERATRDDFTFPHQQQAAELSPAHLPQFEDQWQGPGRCGTAGQCAVC